MKYEGWWRCRIKGRSKVYPWLYFRVAAKNQREYRRAARIGAQMILHRVDCEFEAVAKPPLEHLNLAVTMGELQGFFDTTFGSRP